MKGTWTRVVTLGDPPDDLLAGGTVVQRTLGFTFHPIPEHGADPVYHVTVSLGPGMDFSAILYPEEAQEAVKMLEADGWRKVEP